MGLLHQAVVQVHSETQGKEGEREDVTGVALAGLC